MQKKLLPCTTLRLMLININKKLTPTTLCLMLININKELTPAHYPVPKSPSLKFDLKSRCVKLSANNSLAKIIEGGGGLKASF